MYNTSENKYLVRQNIQNEWLFFHDEHNGICFKKKINTNWNDYKILIRETLSDFDVTIDSNNNIHLACQDKNGNIIYLLFTDKKWHKYTILKSKSNVLKTKNFRIFIINNIVNLMYILVHEEKYLLVHQILHNEYTEPNVVDHIIPSSLPYNIAIDSSNNIYAYYQSERTNSDLGYKCYIWSSKSWGAFKTLDNGKYESASPFVIIDNKDDTHLCYLRKTYDCTELCYIKLPFNYPNKSKWSEPLIMNSTNITENTIPILIKLKNDLYILWQENGIVSYSYSKDNGDTWSNPSKFVVGIHDNTKLFGFRTASDNEKEVIICNLCYGYETNTDINFYVLTNYLKEQIPAKNKQTIKYISEAYDVEKFAQDNMDFFTNKPDYNSTSRNLNEYNQNSGENNIEISKLKILIDFLKEEMSNYQKNFTNELYDVNEKIKNTELTVNELKTFLMEKSETEILNNKNTVNSEEIEEENDEIVEIDENTSKCNISETSNVSENNENQDDITQCDN